MRSLLAFLAIMLCAPTVIAQEKELPPLPSRQEPLSAVIEEWEAYAKKVLLVSFPEHSGLIESMGFEIFSYDWPGERTREHEGKKIIQFSYGTIRGVGTPSEFAVLIGHEFAHEVKGHPFRTGSEAQRIIYGPDHTQMVTILAEELEAEFFAALGVPGGVCAINRNNQRRYGRFFRDSNPPDRYLWQINQRCRLFKDWCEYLSNTKVSR